MNRHLFAATCLALSAFGLGLAMGQPAARAEGTVKAVQPSVPAEASTFDLVVDPAEMAEVEAITARLDRHLSLDGQGLVTLDPSVTPEQLGVTPEFLDNYRQALAFSNQLISSGQIKVDANLKVSATGSFVGSANMPAPGNPGGKGKASEPAPVLGESADNEVPEWCSWRYNSGAMYYNSYNTYNSYGRTGQYYGLCNSMAAYMGYPWMSGSLVNFYTYNNSYFNNYCYPNYGTYYFLPYSSYNSCGGYNPCYNPCSTKPAYFWTRSYTYSYSCRCYQYQWQWSGYWTRY